MDPFVQRMRERARLRKEKVAGYASHEDPIRSPLKDDNKTHAVKFLTKEDVYETEKISNEPQRDILEENENVVNGNDLLDVENKRTDVRDRLRRLGALYSGGASSPIQRTEQKFSAEPAATKPAPERSARLAALANTINQWEDDLSHPSAPSAPCVDDVMGVVPSTVPTEKPAPACAVVQLTPKKSAWDANLMQSLEGQGFARSESNARLEFDFQAKKSPVKPLSTKEAWLQSPTQSKAKNESWRNSSSQLRTSPTKAIISPEKRPLVKGGNIVAKSALFETGRVDPAELTLAERTALFERNAGAAPVPQVPFGTPLPKQLKRSPVKSAVRAIAASSSPQRVGYAAAPAANNPINSAQAAFKSAARAIAATTPEKKSSAGSTPRFGQPAAAANPASKPTNMVGAMQALLAAGGKTERLTTQSLAEDSAAQRQKELSALRNRWEQRQQESGPPAPPPMPPATVQTVPSQPIQPAEPSGSARATNPVPAIGSPGFVGKPDVGRIRVSPPKPGRLYPCLSDIDATETEASDSDDQGRSLSLDSSSDASFGHSILAAVSANSRIADNGYNCANPVTDSSANSSAMDNSFGREVLAAAGADSSDSDTDGPTPPKKTRNENKTSSSAVSHSFHYHRGNEGAEAVADEPLTPLQHTVSFYRRQQAKTSPQKAPSRPVMSDLVEAPVDKEDAQFKVEAKVAALSEEIGRQMAVMSQASRALTLCHATVEFSASQEAVEAERLLLLAGQRRLAAVNEVQRLRVERSLKPLTEFGCQVEEGEKGVVILRDITLPLKRDFLRTMDADPRTQHLVVLAKCQEQVLATHVQPAGPNVMFPGPLRLVDLFSDFKIRLEVYTLQTRREVMSHDAKYHIAGKKDKGRLTPKKRAESRLLMPVVESPGGPNAVRGTGFTLAGFVVFSLAELRRTGFTLNTVSPCSPLEGHVGLRVESQLSTAVAHRGFLTAFQDVSGFGAWHRRWCLLQGTALSFWKYPDDEKTKVPLECIELSACESTSAELVSRQICARPNTILLETSRAALPGDEDSLVLYTKGNRTVLRHLLAADTKEDRIEWCLQINKSLRMLRAWTNSAE